MAPDSSDPAWYRNRQRKVSFNDHEVAAFARQVGREVGGGREFAVVVASDAALRQANARFRGKRYATDVLSFPDGEQGRLGDILISAHRAQRQARGAWTQRRRRAETFDTPRNPSPDGI